jgi:hypothetical protein
MTQPSPRTPSVPQQSRIRTYQLNQQRRSSARAHYRQRDTAGVRRGA